MALSTRTRTLLVALLLGLIGAGLFVAGVRQFLTLVRLEARGVKVPGKVVDGRVQTGPHNGIGYFLTVTYAPRPGDAPTRREFAVSKAGFDDGKQTSDVQVRLLPGDPEAAQIVGEETTGFLFTAVGVLFLASGILAFRTLGK
jgi:hypothetical protein